MIQKVVLLVAEGSIVGVLVSLLSYRKRCYCLLNLQFDSSTAFSGVFFFVPRFFSKWR